MAPTQKRKSDYDSDRGFVAADSASPDSRPTKISKSKHFAPASLSNKDENGDPYWEISKNRRVTISTFKGKKMVSIREYYEQGGKMLPGKKGISMMMEQYGALIELLPIIEKFLTEGGEKVPRPRYDGSQDEGMGDDENPEEDEEDDEKKANIEATSDEDGS